MANKNRGLAKKAQIVTKVVLRQAQISPQKARLVVDLIKGKQIEPALAALDFMPKKSARLTSGLLRSGVANAREQGADIDNLWVVDGWVDMGRSRRSLLHRARGSANILRKHASHITLVLGEIN